MPQALTIDQVRHIAKLSRLHLDAAEEAAYGQQLSQVLDYVAQLNEVDVTNVEPMAHALDLTNALRDDQETPGLTVDAALANAPDRDPPFFKVPKVLDDGGGA